jgi:dephospho-CoA kinase
MLGADGRLDRARLAERVFADEAARQKLNGITWPRVREWSAQRVAQATAQDAPLVVMDVPLLYEAGLDKGLAVVVVVWVPEEEQVRRAVARGMDEADVRARVKAQMPLDEKRRRATHVIDNSGELADTRAAVARLWSELTAA